MAKTPANKYDKLPKWAVQEITDLRRDVAEARHESKQLREALPPSDVFWFQGDLDGKEVYLPKNTPVYFKVGEAWNDKFCVYRDGNDNWTITAHKPGLRIKPVVSNMVILEMVK